MAKTIAAIATPHGVGGIGVVRLSGDRAVEIAQAVFRAADGSRLSDLPGYTARFGSVAQGEKAFDQAVALVFRAPRSYTGEDVVELSVHGGLVTVERTLQAVLAAGAAPAGPGEFTKRAFLHGKMDLTEAESVADLISASGQAAADSAYTALSAARNAAAQLHGALRRDFEAVTERLLDITSRFYAVVDYPDEEIPELSGDTLLESLQQAQGLLSHLLAGYDNGQLMTAGVDTVIVGRPNVGKSALMNDLTGQETSIVTAVQGTTRDVVERTVRLGDLTLRLADTAGLRQTDDVVEQIGVERAQARLQQARLVLAVFDGSTPLTSADEELMTLCKGKNAVAVVNKNDLPPAAVQEKIGAAFDRVVAYSAKNHTGRDDLAVAVADALGVQNFDAADPLLANERQRQCCQTAADCVAEAVAALEGGMTYDAVNVSIDAAADALLSLTGARATQAVVDRIFEKFCVGK